MRVEVVATDEIMWKGEADSVIAPALNGDIGILPGRQPVLAVLRPGKVRITPKDGEKLTFAVDTGFLSVDDDHVQVVVDNSKMV